MYMCAYSRIFAIAKEYLYETSAKPMSMPRFGHEVPGAFTNISNVGKR